MSESLANLLSSEQLFDLNPGPPSPFYAVLGFIFAVILGVGISLYLKREQLSTGVAPILRFLTGVSTGAIAVGGIGVVLVLARFLTIPVLSMRVLLYLLIIVTLGLAGYLVYYFRRVLPKQLVTYQRPRYGAKPVPRIVPRAVPRGGLQKKKGKRRK